MRNARATSVGDQAGAGATTVASRSAPRR